MDERQGTIIVDGKIIDLDKTSIEDLKELEKKLKNEEEKIRKEIDKLLNIKN